MSEPNSNTTSGPPAPLSHQVYLALGGNLGDRRANLTLALERLRASGHLAVEQISRLYETEPVGYADQPCFLNAVAQARTDLTPLALLDYLKEVESGLGREATFRNGPRPIDLDIIFYDNLTLAHERLQIPHPRLRGRGFVLAPLAELAPDYRHPELEIAVAQMLRELDLNEIGVKLYEAEPGLEVPPPRFLFVTGKLAESWLSDFLAELGPRLGFGWGVKALNIDVAAFMTSRFIADHLTLSLEEGQSFDQLIVPGFTSGELQKIAEATGLGAVRGPTDLCEIEPFMAALVQAHVEPRPTPLYYTEEQLRRMQACLTDPNIRIYTDGQRIFAFNNAVFGSAEPDERGMRTLFRLLKIDNPAHAYYLGREFYKASLCLRLGRPYHQDREIEGLKLA